MLDGDFWNKVEHYNGKLILPCIGLLLIIIVIEVFIHPTDERIKLGIKIADMFVISVFVIDLIFLYKRAHEQGHNWKFFIRKYWLDILAVLPFGLIAEGIGKTAIAVTAAEKVTLGQGVIHESLELSKAEKIAKVAREIKIGARVIRIISKSNQIERFKRKVVQYF